MINSESTEKFSWVIDWFYQGFCLGAFGAYSLYPVLCFLSTPFLLQSSASLSRPQGQQPCHSKPKLIQIYLFETIFFVYRIPFTPIQLNCHGNYLFLRNTN